jgi:putative N6-adenine-specific DNA methylase
MSSALPQKIYVSCAPGLEPFLADEIRSLGITLPDLKTASTTLAALQGSEEEKGGIEFSGTEQQVYLCNLHLRTASRVVVRLGEFYAAAFSELRKKASRLAWDQYLSAGQPVEVKVTCHKSRLYHSDAVAERVKGAIDDHFHKISRVAGKDEKVQLIHVRLVNDLCTISIDSSGELLHRRGYRQAVAKAPLRETLAAGILLASGWQPGTPLVDPFCGSGTIPIEAAMITRGIAPGINRSFAFQNWSGFKVEAYNAMLNTVRKNIKASQTPIYASDRDQGAVEMATANAARTGVNRDIHFACHALSNLPVQTGPGWIITNPPYGVRVSSAKDLRNLYASLGKLLRTEYQGWSLGFLCNDTKLVAALELGKPKLSISLLNGGIPVRFSIFPG